jgi:hypothetical protein
MKTVESNVESLKRGKSHDLKLKQEMRRLKEDDLKKTLE